MAMLLARLERPIMWPDMRSQYSIIAFEYPGREFRQKDVYAIISWILCRSGSGRYCGDRAHRRVRA
jgi:hypothetical protein